MLLNKLRARLRRAEAARDEGAVLISVIAVSMVVIILTALVASSAVTAATFSSVTRANLQSRAAAEAGIDIVWSSIQQGTFLCTSQPPTSATLQYVATVSYYNAAGTALTCSGTSTLSGTPAKAVVSSKGLSRDDGVGHANSGDERTVIALFDIVVNNNQAVLDKVFFTDGSYTITNSTSIIDGSGLGKANIYSNTSVDCKTAISIQGNVYVQGDFITSNKCVISGSVWAGGSVTAYDQMYVSGDVMSMGGTNPLAPTLVDLEKAWVGGSVVANGDVKINTSANNAYCSVAGYLAKVCGSIVSIEGKVQLSNGANVAGNIIAKKVVDIGSTNSVLMVGGNVISSTAGLLASNNGPSGYRVGGYVALFGSSQVPKARIGNQASSCATGTTGLSACNPANPPIPLGGLPSALNFPTNTRVVAPPRESLARINSDPIALAGWGWSVESVNCASLNARINAGWTGKKIFNVTGCTAPLNWDNKSFNLPGDLALIIPSGIKAQNDLTFTGTPSPNVRTLMLIVPSDAKLADGTTPLVTWTNPIATDPGYSKPNCASGDYGDIRSSKISTVRVETFIYTPCEFDIANQLLNFNGQIYTGSAVYPNNSSIVYKPIVVPGATTPSAAALPSVIATQTSRFDAR